MVNLREIAFKTAIFRSFSSRFPIIFTDTTVRLYLAAARRGTKGRRQKIL
jgi:hypothetical protein